MEEDEFDLAQKLAAYTPEQLSRFLFWYLRRVARSIEVERAFLTAGANPLAMETTGRNYLSYAQTREEIELFITAGTPVNMRDPFHGKAAIHWVVSKSKTLESLYLAESGADLWLKDRYGHDPMWYTERLEVYKDCMVAHLRKLRIRFSGVRPELVPENTGAPFFIRGVEDQGQLRTLVRTHPAHAENLMKARM